MVKDRFIRIAPFIMLMIGLTFIPFISSENLYFLTLILLFALTNALKNLYFVNKNIKNNIIWINQTIDRLLGIIAGCLYLGYAGIVLISQSHV